VTAWENGFGPGLWQESIFIVSRVVVFVLAVVISLPGISVLAELVMEKPVNLFQSGQQNGECIARYGVHKLCCMPYNQA
jgi:hypothetical protein